MGEPPNEEDEGEDEEQQLQEYFGNVGEFLDEGVDNADVAEGILEVGEDGN